MKLLRKVLARRLDEARQSTSEKETVIMRGRELEARRARLEKELQLAEIRLRGRYR